MMRGNLLNSRNGEVLQQIYAAVGMDSFRASDVPGIDWRRFSGMQRAGMLDRIEYSTRKKRSGAKYGGTQAVWKISEPGLCVLRGEKMRRN